MSPTVSPLDSFGERLRRAADSVTAAKATYDDAITLRDEVVLEAIDEAGLSIATTAKLAHLSPARVIQIVAKAG